MASKVVKRFKWVMCVMFWCLIWISVGIKTQALSLQFSLSHGLHLAGARSKNKELPPAYITSIVLPKCTGACSVLPSACTDYTGCFSSQPYLTWCLSGPSSSYRTCPTPALLSSPSIPLPLSFISLLSVYNITFRYMGVG